MTIDTRFLPDAVSALGYAWLCYRISATRFLKKN